MRLHTDEYQERHDARIVTVGHDGTMALEPPAFKLNGQAEIRSELDAQIDLLAAMFDDAGLSALRRRLPSHPAVTRYDALVALRGSSVSPDTEHGLIKEVAWALMDRSTWAANPSVRPFWETSVPDEPQRVQVLARIRHPEQFDAIRRTLIGVG